MKRYAIIWSGNDNAVSAYLPANYHVIYCGINPDDIESKKVTVIAGTDNAGWTLDDYVLPRLASSLYFGSEIDLSHPVMKVIPDDTREHCTCPGCEGMQPHD